MFLAANSRQHIAFAVHQCARFTHCTRRSHEQAVIRICRYLKGTKQDGMIFRPSKNMMVDCYADADFAGLWGAEDPHDPVCVKSRTGYVVTIANCPLLWVSKLQTEHALSTLHAEYVALSQSIRDLIPLKEIIQEVVDALGLPQDVKYVSHSTVFEYNQGAISLARCPRMTPRTNHIGTKCHWFRSHLGKLFDVVHVESAKQKADIFTKGLQGQVFLSIRKHLCGW